MSEFAGALLTSSLGVGMIVFFSLFAAAYRYSFSAFFYICCCYFVFCLSRMAPKSSFGPSINTTGVDFAVVEFGYSIYFGAIIG